MKHARWLVLALAAGMAAAPLGAQQRGKDKDRDDRDRGNGRQGSAQGIPPGHLPPAGRCRVWYDGRPAGRQPAPTSCAAARETAARTGGRVIYGDGARRDDDRDGRRECDDKDRRKDDKKSKDECRERDENRDRDDDDRDDDDRRRDDDERGRDRDRDWSCVDANRDGRCDNGGAMTYPATLPDMKWGISFGRGEAVEDVRKWLGTGNVRATYRDANRDGAPESVTWYEGRTIVQRWVDVNADNRADQVMLYRNGKVVRVIR